MKEKIRFPGFHDIGNILVQSLYHMHVYTSYTICILKYKIWCPISRIYFAMTFPYKFGDLFGI